MEDRTSGNSSTTAVNSPASGTRHEGRSVWVLTAYAISGLVLFGVLIYFFSTYITQ